MPPKKDLCRNFQRGSCRYGDLCKFIHSTSQAPQQSRTNNPFGFGVQTSTTFQHTNQQQQTPNPFGFGAQNNNGQPRGNIDFGSKPTQSKPFENKWSRLSSSNSSSAPASRQSNSQQQATNHKCTDSESCKRMMMEDLENEKPLWKVTCYGHNKDGPCDIVGDISCEELRALAYEEAKQGKSLQLIIERERSLLNSKLVEFQNLVQKPYTVSSNAALSPQNPFAMSHSNPITNNGVPPPVSSFSQLGASLNTRPAAAPTYTFGQSNVVQNNTNTSGLFQTNSSSNVPGAFGSQISQKSFQSFFPFGPANPSNSMANVNKNLFSTFGNSSQIGNAAGNHPNNSMTSVNKNPFSTFTNSSQIRNAAGNTNPFSTFTNSPQNGNAAGNQLGFVSNLSSSASINGETSSIGTNLADNLPTEDSNVDDSIWTKEWRWNEGEIPEQPPPEIHIH